MFFTAPLPPAASNPSGEFILILNMFRNLMVTMLRWFLDCLNRSSLVPYFLASFFVFLCMKFLISPLIGSAGSDQVKRKKD